MRDADPYETGDRYDDAAIARARKKLAAIHSRAVLLEPAGRLRYFGAGIVFALLALSFLAAGFALDEGSPSSDNVGLIIFGVIALPFVICALVSLIGSRPTSPRKALKLYYRSLATAKYKFARSMVVPNDLDDFPRYTPDIRGLGPPNRDPITFSGPGFREFWRRTLLYPSWPLCVARVSSVKTKAVTDDILIADHRVRMQINTRWFYLLIFVALLIALIVILVTNKNVNAANRKILVRVDDEWHVFNGEWQGPEEEDIGWLTQQQI